MGRERLFRKMPVLGQSHQFVAVRDFGHRGSLVIKKDRRVWNLAGLLFREVWLEEVPLVLQ